MNVTAYSSHLRQRSSIGSIPELTVRHIIHMQHLCDGPVTDGDGEGAEIVAGSHRRGREEVRACEVNASSRSRIASSCVKRDNGRYVSYPLYF